MKITAVSSFAVAMPNPPGRYSSTTRAGTKREWDRLSRRTPHRPDPVLEYVIIRIDTDEGITGYGESTPDIGFFGETLEQVKSAVDNYFGPRLIGKDPLDRERILFELDFRGNSCARSGLDLAVHDLIGKKLNLPVSALIGGSFRSRITAAIEIAGGPANEMAKVCADLVAKGVRAFKPKIGGIPEDDVDRLRAIREAVGKDVMIRADANQGFTPKEAIRLCRLAEKYDVGLELLEQPVPYWNLAGMAEVRGAVDTLIEADESCYTIHDAMNIVRQGAADVLNIKIEKVGGLYNAKKVAAIAEGAGLQAVVGTAFGLGITMAAKLHLAASTAMIRDAVEFTEMFIHENLMLAPNDRQLALPLKNGELAVPTGPGLGVEVDLTRAAMFRSPIVD